MAAYLKQNPRLMGILFTLTLLLTQAGTAAAGGNGCTIA
jgi:hypothetical protein